LNDYKNDVSSTGIEITLNFDIVLDKQGKLDVKETYVSFYVGTLDGEDVEQHSKRIAYKFLAEKPSFTYHISQDKKSDNIDVYFSISTDSAPYSHRVSINAKDHDLEGEWVSYIIGGRAIAFDSTVDSTFKRIFKSADGDKIEETDVQSRDKKFESQKFVMCDKYEFGDETKKIIEWKLDNVEDCFLQYGSSKDKFWLEVNDVKTKPKTN
jgi:hypothetical protein